MVVNKSQAARESLRKSLLAWYERAGRNLPWRSDTPDPYRVWLSEIMLQQTTVAAVKPYFERFLNLFPNVAALGEAPQKTILAAWAGLGYYSRARNLHAAAKQLAACGFPETEEGWRALPGVGPYTAAAIAAIAYGRPANVVDGNVERVMARLHAIETPLPAAKPVLRDLASELVTSDRPGDWAQALMDLGATICTPKSPRCGDCPWSKACAALATGAPERFPLKTPKPRRPERAGAAFVLERRGEFWLVRRPQTGLLAGMAGLPTTPWEEGFDSETAFAFAPAQADWRSTGAVRHVFTHFALTLHVWRADDATPSGEGWWADREAAGALPTVFKKALML